MAVESYNALVDRRNDIVRSYNRAGGAYKQREIAFNDSVKQSQRDIQTRCKELDAQKTAVQDQLAVYKRWVESRSDAAFFKEVNGFYAHLYKEVVAGKTPELVTMIDRVAAIRHELGLQAITDQAEAGGGLVIVEATLCRQEKCFLIVDTGATTVTISRALVDVLGLSHRLGKPVQATLADGTAHRGT